MASRYELDDTYEGDDRAARRQSYLDQLDNQSATRDTADTGGSSSAPSSPGSLPPSATPPSPSPQPAGFLSGDQYPNDQPVYSSPGQPIAAVPQQDPWVPPTVAGQWWDPNVAAYIPNGVQADPTGYHMVNGQLTGNQSGAQAGQAQQPGRTDANAIRQQIQQWMASNNPQGHQDAEYWVQRILQTGGLGQDNLQYWLGRFTEAPGTHQEGGSAPINPFPYQYTPGSGVVSPEISQYFKSLTDQINASIAQNQSLMDARRSALLQLMNQGQQPVDVQNDPTLKGASDAYRLSRRRAEQEDRAKLAERAAFVGLNSGGQGSGSFDAGVANLGENASRDIAGYDANLALNELNNRRQYLVQAISIADAIGARNESQQLNTVLAQIDSAMKQAQLGYQYSALGQQGNQFADSMAYNYANLIQQANRDALLYG